MQGFFNRCQIGQAKLGLNHFNVRYRVYLAGHVNHVVVFKAAHHIHRGIGLTDMRQKFVAQAFTRAGARHQACNVDKLNDGFLYFLRVNDGGQLVQPRIRKLHNAHIRLNGAKRIVFSRDARFGQRVEQGGFTDVRQADNAAFQTHDKP